MAQPALLLLVLQQEFPGLNDDALRFSIESSLEMINDSPGISGCFDRKKLCHVEVLATSVDVWEYKFPMSCSQGGEIPSNILSTEVTSV